MAEPRFFRVIACEIALREICFLAAHSRSLVDLEFLPQGLHDRPKQGLQEVQHRIDAVPPGRYDAILLGYGLCGNLIAGLQARHTPLVIPRAHDCITFFLGSRQRHQQLLQTQGGSYYYTAGWLEVLRRRGGAIGTANASFLPTPAGLGGSSRGTYDDWVKKYGQEKAQYLAEVMDAWTAHYTHGVLIQFDFTRHLDLRQQVHAICAQRGWQFQEIQGDLTLLRRWLDGDWDPADFLIVQPGQTVVPSYTDEVLSAQGP